MMGFLGRLRRRRLRKLGRIWRDALVAQFGKKEFYSGDEIEKVAQDLKLRLGRVEELYVMFAEPEACEEFLERIRSSNRSDQLRVLLAGQMFGTGHGVGYDACWNVFHDPDDEIGGGVSSVGSSPVGGGSFMSDSDGGDFGDGGWGGGDGGGD